MNNHLLELKEDYDQALIEREDHNLLLIRNISPPCDLLPGTYSPLLKRHNALLKRIFDIMISLTVLIFLLSWLLPLLALLIVIDSPGPVFFIQKRNKKNGRIFYCFKLRTMHANEDADRLTALINDKRVTGFGKFLRASHLDELPQFINVLIGDMSIVGPRPHMIIENIRFKGVIHFYNDRHFVKPGITGLAQSFGYHGPVADLKHLNRKTGYDIFYIKNWSVGMDIKILIRTACMIVNKFNPGR